MAGIENNETISFQKHTGQRYELFVKINKFFSFLGKFFLVFRKLYNIFAT